jgi:hypothetical protein
MTVESRQSMHIIFLAVLVAYERIKQIAEVTEDTYTSYRIKYN